MTNELVSVIMSTCNTDDRQLFLSISSILNQTYKNLELIVIIDGGRQNECLSKFSDKRLRIIRHREGRGLAARLNEAISLAKGRYIARMDSDDYALPDRIDRQYCFMESHPSVDVCSMFIKTFGKNRKVRVSASTTDKYIQSDLFLNCILVHPTIMFRKSFIKEKDITYNEDFNCAQDFELWSRLIGKCVFATIPVVGIFYRIHDKQITKNRKNEQIRNRNAIIEGNMRRLDIGAEEAGYINIIQESVSWNNVDDAQNFISRCVSNNDEVGLFDRTSFKKVLYRHLFTTSLKNKHFLLCLRVLRPYDIYYLTKTILLAQKCNFQVLKYRKIYKELMKGV